MNYIIDGHNLISKLPGLDLSMPDDEERLIEVLNRYGTQNHGRIEVYFDGAPAGQAGVRNFGRVRAHFVLLSHTADEAIQARLALLGKSARNWTVVSSDRSVQAAAHEARAGVMKSEDFVHALQSSRQIGLSVALGSPDHTLNKAEVEEWLALFKAWRNPK